MKAFRYRARNRGRRLRARGSAGVRASRGTPAAARRRPARWIGRSGGGAASSGGAVDRGSGGGGGGSVASRQAAGRQQRVDRSGGSGSDFSSPSAERRFVTVHQLRRSGAREFAPRHREGFSGSGLSYRDDGAAGHAALVGAERRQRRRRRGRDARRRRRRRAVVVGSSGGGSAAIRFERRRRAQHEQDAHGPGARSERRLAQQRDRRARSSVVEPSARRSSGDRHGRGAHRPAARSRRRLPRPLRLLRPVYGYGYGGYGYGYGFGYCGYYGYYPYGFGMGYGLYSGSAGRRTTAIRSAIPTAAATATAAGPRRRTAAANRAT